MTVAAWICLLLPLVGALAITAAGTSISRRTAAAAARRSSMRLLVHEPMNTVSTATSRIGVPAVSPMYCRARAADSDRLAAETRLVADLDGGVKAVHIEMNDCAPVPVSFHAAELK